MSKNFKAVNKTSKPRLGESLIESAGSAEMSDVAADAWDIALDAFLDDGVLKDIPVIGWAVKTIQAGQSVRDALFLKKIAMFLKGAASTSAEEKKRFTEKVESDNEYRRKVGEALILLIDRHERIEKSLLLGRLFAAHMKGEISTEIFMRLSAVLDKAVTEDLEELNKRRPHFFMVSKEIEASLYRCGLMDIKIEVPELHPLVSGNGLKMKGEYDYEMNQLGKLFVKYAFEPLEKEQI